MADFKLNYTGTEINAIINAMANLIDTIYPVGSIYISANSANPGTFFPNTTWVQIKDTFLLAAGDTYSAGSTGGEATHALTVAELAKHGHPIYVWDDAGTKANAYYYNGATQTTHSGARVYTGSSSTWYTSGTTANAAGSGRGDPSGGAGQIGSGTAHNNMPPYLTVYVWQRTE